jgi:hypothetical protein
MEGSDEALVSPKGQISEKIPKAKHQTRIYSGRHKESVLDDDWEILPRFQAKSALALGWIHAFSAGLEYTRNRTCRALAAGRQLA